MPKVVISAFACGPDQTSEPAVGWDTVMAMAQFKEYELWVLVEVGAEEKIRAWETANELQNVHFVFLGSRWIAGMMRRIFT
jgi:hypothetical protein